MKCWLQADENTDEFLQDEHSFDEYVREVRRYRKLVDEITYKSVKVSSVHAHISFFLYHLLFNVLLVATRFLFG